MHVNWDRVRVVVNGAGRVRCEPGWMLPGSWVERLQDFDLWFVWAGRGRMILKDRRITLRPGICVWARPGRYYEAYQDADDRLGVSFIHFDLIDAAHPSRKVARPIPPEVTDLRDVPLADAMMRRIGELLRDPRHTDHAARTANALMRSLLIDLDYQASHQADLSGTQRLHRQVALQVAAHIDENPGDTHDIAALARHAGYCPDHLCRVFRAVTGQTLQSYTIRARINRARHLLLETELPVHQIAAALGYSDVFFFSRQFKQKAGQSPLAYRRQTGP